MTNLIVLLWILGLFMLCLTVSLLFIAALYEYVRAVWEFMKWLFTKAE